MRRRGAAARGGGERLLAVRGSRPSAALFCFGMGEATQGKGSSGVTNSARQALPPWPARLRRGPAAAARRTAFDGLLAPGVAVRRSYQGLFSSSR